MNNIHNEKFLICNVYRPPSYPVEFWERFNICLEQATDYCPQIIVLGDINEDQLNTTNDKFKKLMLLNNLHNIIKNPTRVSINTETLLDPIAISRNIKSAHADIIKTPPSVSDHYGTLAIIQIHACTNTAYYGSVWNYKNADFISPNESIRSTEWSFLHTGYVNETTDRFTDCFMGLIKTCIPNKKVVIRPNDKPWYNSQIRSISRKRDRCKAKAIRSGLSNDWKNYKSLRNKVNNMKKHAKSEFYSMLEYTLCDLKINNPRQYWKPIKITCNRKL